MTGTLAKRAKLTKAMWNLVIVDSLLILAFLIFVTIVALTSLKISEIGIRPTDIRTAIYAFFGVNIFLLLAFGLAEIVINFRHGRGFKE
ncbi:hypothetical protein D3C86_1968470 [compost metagenome]